jgi:hypothetical protein
MRESAVMVDISFSLDEVYKLKEGICTVISCGIC